MKYREDIAMVMKEIKFVSHIVRNIYLFFTFSVVLDFLFLFHFHISAQQFIFGLVTFSLGYSAVYFINDSIDYKEDAQYGRANLYLQIKSKTFYWSLVCFLVIGD
jgi:4-hydroxybenzoate polyprenyltransferase